MCFDEATQYAWWDDPCEQRMEESVAPRAIDCVPGYRNPFLGDFFAVVEHVVLLERASKVQLLGHLQLYSCWDSDPGLNAADRDAVGLKGRLRLCLQHMGGFGVHLDCKVLRLGDYCEASHVRMNPEKGWRFPGKESLSVRGDDDEGSDGTSTAHPSWKAAGIVVPPRPGSKAWKKSLEHGTVWAVRRMGGCMGAAMILVRAEAVRYMESRTVGLAVLLEMPLAAIGLQRWQIVKGCLFHSPKMLSTWTLLMTGRLCLVAWKSLWNRPSKGRRLRREGLL